MRRLLPFIFFAIVICVFLWKPIFTGAALLPGDYLQGMLGDPSPDPQTVRQWNPLQFDAIAQFYPWRVFYARWMSQGILPLWNPHQFCGTPFQANGQSAILYPLNLVFLLFSPVKGFTLYAFIHLLLAAWFTYLLMRSLGVGRVGGVVAGTVFALSAFMVVWLELPTFIGAAIWLPAACWLAKLAVDRRSVILSMLSGAAVAMAFLAGHFQMAFYVGMAAGLFWVWLLVSGRRASDRSIGWKTPVGYLAAFVVIAGAVAAPQILPTQELASNSHRVRETTSEGYDRFISNALAPYRLITIFSPNYYGSPATNDYYLLGNIQGHPGSAADYMEYGAYAGVGSLVLACLGVALVRRRRYAGFFIGLGALALLTATGTAINLVFYYLLPGFSALGGPNRIILLWCFSVAVLAGFGGDGLLNQREWSLKSKLKISAGAIRAVVSFAVISFLYLGARAAAGALTIDLSQFAEAKSEGIPLVWAGLAAGLSVLYLLGTLNRKLFAGVIVALVAADMFAFGINYNPTCDRSKVYPETGLTQFLKHNTKEERIAPINPTWSLYQVPEAILPPNSAMVYELNDVQGYDSLFPKAYKERMAAATGVTDPCPPENGNMVMAKKIDPGLATVGAKYAISLSSTNSNVSGSRAVGGALVSELLGVRTPVEKYLSPNKIQAEERTHCPTYPGWKVRVEDRAFVFQPFSFRLGRFLMCLGVMAIAAAGSAGFVLRKRASRGD